jgi:hypothetical protein
MDKTALPESSGSAVASAPEKRNPAIVDAIRGFIAWAVNGTTLYRMNGFSRLLI